MDQGGQLAAHRVGIDHHDVGVEALGHPATVDEAEAAFDGSKPRKVRELYADIAYRVDVGQRAGGEEAGAPDGSGAKPLVTPTPDDWPV